MKSIDDARSILGEPAPALRMTRRPPTSAPSDPVGSTWSAAPLNTRSHDMAATSSRNASFSGLLASSRPPYSNSLPGTYSMNTAPERAHGRGPETAGLTEAVRSLGPVMSNMTSSSVVAWSRLGCCATPPNIKIFLPDAIAAQPRRGAGMSPLRMGSRKFALRRSEVSYMAYSLSRSPTLSPPSTYRSRSTTTAACWLRAITGSGLSSSGGFWSVPSAASPS
eukprot:365589-Chlamydomonas_euryale.AAC.4